MIATLAVQVSVPLAVLLATDRGFARRGAFTALYLVALAAVGVTALGPDGRARLGEGIAAAHSADGFEFALN